MKTNETTLNDFWIALDNNRIEMFVNKDRPLHHQLTYLGQKSWKSFQNIS